MSGNLGRAVFILDADANPLERGLQGAEASVRGFTDRSSRLLRTGLAVSFGAPAFVAGIVAANTALKLLTEGVVGFNSTLDQSTDVFTKYRGSAEEAAARVQELFSFAKETPFDFQGVLKGASVLESLGGKALATTENMRLFGDAAAATVNITGDLSTSLERTNFWVARFYSALNSGAPLGEALLRLQELGLVTDKYRAQVELAVQAGANPGQIFEQFKSQLGRFSGLMDLQQKNFTTQLSTIKDNFLQLSAIVGRPIFDAFVTQMERANRRIGGQGAQQLARGASRVIADQIKNAGELITDPEFVRGAEASAKALIEFAKTFAAFMGQVKDTIGPVLEGVATLTRAIDSLTQGNAATIFAALAAARTFRRPIELTRDLALGRANIFDDRRDAQGRRLLGRESEASDAIRRERQVSPLALQLGRERDQVEKAQAALDAVQKTSAARSSLEQARLSERQVQQIESESKARERARDRANTALARAQAETQKIELSESDAARRAAQVRVDAQRRIQSVTERVAAPVQAAYANEQNAINRAAQARVNAVREQGAIVQQGLQKQTDILTAAVERQTIAWGRHQRALDGVTAAQTKVSVAQQISTARQGKVAGLETQIQNRGGLIQLEHDAQLEDEAKRRLDRARRVERSRALDTLTSGDTTSAVTKHADAVRLANKAQTDYEGQLRNGSRGLLNEYKQAQLEAAEAVKGTARATEELAARQAIADRTQGRVNSLDAAKNQRVLAAQRETTERLQASQVSSADKIADADNKARQASDRTLQTRIAGQKQLAAAHVQAAEKIAAADSAVIASGDRVAAARGRENAVRLNTFDARNAPLTSAIGAAVATGGAAAASAASINQVTTALTGNAAAATKASNATSLNIAQAIRQDVAHRTAQAAQDRLTAANEKAAATQAKIDAVNKRQTTSYQGLSTALVGVGLALFAINAVVEGQTGQSLTQSASDWIKYGDIVTGQIKRINDARNLRAPEGDLQAQLAKEREGLEEKRRIAQEIGAGGVGTTGVFLPFSNTQNDILRGRVAYVRTLEQERALLAEIARTGNPYAAESVLNAITEQEAKIKSLNDQIEAGIVLRKLFNDEQYIANREAIKLYEEGKGPKPPLILPDRPEVDKRIADDKTVQERSQQTRTEGLNLPKEIIDRLTVNATEYQSKGREALRAYFSGFDDEATKQFDNLRNVMEVGLKNSRPEGKLTTPDLIDLASLDRVLAQAIGQIKETGTVAEDVLAKIRSGGGPAATELEKLVHAYERLALVTKGVETATERYKQTQADLKQGTKDVADAIKFLDDAFREAQDKAKARQAKDQEAIDGMQRSLTAVQRVNRDAQRLLSDNVAGATAKLEGVRADAERAAKEDQRRIEEQSKVVEKAQQSVADHAGAFDAVLTGQTERFLRQHAEVDDLTKAILGRYEAEIGAARRLKDATSERAGGLERGQRRELLAFDEAIATARERGDRAEVARLSRLRGQAEQRGSRTITLERSRAAVAQDDFDAKAKTIQKDREEIADADTLSLGSEEKKLKVIQEQAKTNQESREAEIAAQQEIVNLAQEALKARQQSDQDHEQALSDAIAEEQAAATERKKEDDRALAAIEANQEVVRDGLAARLLGLQKADDFAKDQLQYAEDALKNQEKIVDAIIRENKLIAEQEVAWQRIIDKLTEAGLLKKITPNNFVPSPSRPDTERDLPSGDAPPSDSGGLGKAGRDGLGNASAPTGPNARLPKTGGLSAFALASAGGGGGGGGFTYNQNAALGTFYVREEADINKIASAIAREQQASLLRVVAAGVGAQAGA